MVSYPVGLADTEAPESRGPAASDVLARGTLVNRYVILDRLGAGGMGVVYTAYDPELRRRVALKFLLASGSAIEMQLQQARLLREAQAIARLSHPNVVSVFDAGTFRDQVFVAMEYVDGQTLRAWCQAEARGWQQILAVFLSAARGLSAAHAAGLVHRDFKPENVLIGKDDRVRVLDFGLARPTDISVSGPIPSHDSIMVSDGDALKLSLTRSGVMAGTPAYMSPEQFLAAQADARSDQFSFCVALYELLYGQRPFAGANIVELINNVTSGKLRLPPRGSGVPTRIRRVILRGLAGTPARRHASMDALIRAFEAARGGRIFGWLLLLSLGLTCVAMLSFVLLFAGTGNEFCHAAADRAAATWGIPRRLGVARDFIGSGQTYATDSFHHVDEILTRYTRGLRDLHRDACDSPAREASPERFAMQTQCLELRLTGVTELIALLAPAPDPRVVEHAIEASHRLLPISQCASTAHLRPAPTVTPGQQAVLETLRSRLVRTGLLIDLGLYDRASAELDAHEPQIRELGVRPLVAELQLVRMRLLVVRGDPEAAYHAARAALDDAVASSRDDLAVQALRHLHLAAGLQRGDDGEAEIWAAQALAFLDRLGPDAGIDRAVMQIDSAAIRERQGHFVEARILLEQALAALEALADPDPVVVIAAHTGLANVLLRLGESETAIARLEWALLLSEAAFGPTHPRSAAARRQLGRAHARIGDREAAVRELRAALAITLAAGGRDPTELVSLRSELAALLFELGQTRDAELLARAALESSARDLGPDHPARVPALPSLGRVARTRADLGEARLLFEWALNIAEASHGAQDREAAEARTELAELALRAGDLDTADSHAKLALPVLAAAPDAAGALVRLHDLITAIDAARPPPP